MQQSAWLISLVLMVSIVVIFAWVLLGASTRTDVARDPYKLRGAY